jgi:hypothetical protein
MGDSTGRACVIFSAAEAHVEVPTYFTRPRTAQFQ